MVKEFSAISELKYIREQKSRLSEREQELTKPILLDLSIIPTIFNGTVKLWGIADYLREEPVPASGRNSSL